MQRSSVTFVNVGNGKNGTNLSAIYRSQVFVVK